MNKNLAIKIVLSIVIAVTLFHILILAKIIPYTIAWGGRLTNDSDMYVFESISIAINLLLLFVLLMKGAFIKPLLSQKVLNVILYVFLILFILNTIGNIFSKTNFEKLFALVTLGLAVLLWLIVKKDKTIDP